MSKLILTHEVTGLGSAGDVVEVKNGYARNYLIPQGFAVAWSRGGEKQIESIKAARAARELATIEDQADDLKAKLEAAPVKLTVKAGTDGRLFGSVKTSDIADAVGRGLGGEVDKRTIELGPRSRPPVPTRRRSVCATTCSPPWRSTSSPPDVVAGTPRSGHTGAGRRPSARSGSLECIQAVHDRWKSPVSATGRLPCRQANVQIQRRKRQRSERMTISTHTCGTGASLVRDVITTATR